jgi:hypothetical protein
MPLDMALDLVVSVWEEWKYELAFLDGNTDMVEFSFYA